MVSKLATTLLYICMYVCMPYLSRISIAESSCNVPANCHFCCDMNSLIKKNFLLIWCSQAENQKKYAEFDSRFKSSQVLKDLLEKSKQNKLKNEREIQDKYCLRGAEWGVGDCSTEGMSDQEKEDFIAELKKRTGQE
jgi:hypothetical protein